MGECYGELAFFWLTVYVVTVAVTPKRYRLYSINGLIIVALVTRFIMDGITQSISQSGGAMALLAVAINVAIWADNWDTERK